MPIIFNSLVIYLKYMKYQFRNFTFPHFHFMCSYSQHTYLVGHLTLFCRAHRHLHLSCLNFSNAAIWALISLVCLCGSWEKVSFLGRFRPKRCMVPLMPMAGALTQGHCDTGKSII